jgi:outer membrane protein OmpA-like peptidoglycan-associated protein
MSNLLDAIKGYITPDLIAQAAAHLGENESGILKAVAGLAPAMLAGIANKSADTDAQDGLFGHIAGFNPAALDHLGNLLGSANLAHNDPKDAAGHLLGYVFGSKVPAITSAVSAYSGIKNDSASTLWGLVGPMVMGLLSKHISTDGLNAAGFANWMAEEKSSFAAALPGNIGSLLGLSGAAASDEPVASSGTGWLWPFLLLLALGGGIIYYMKNCTTKTVVGAKVETPVVSAAPTSKPTVYEETLPGGFKLSGAMTGIESQLVGFIKDAGKPVDKTTWFSFDHLNFKSGSAELDMEYSKQQLANIYEVLKAYPKVKLKIGGYTDNVGAEAANMKLSQARAVTVANALAGMGIDKTRLDPEGYGSQHPVAGNDTEEGRAQNRRIAVRVTEK